MARIAVFKAEIDDGPDVLRWLDRMLIRLVRVMEIISDGDSVKRWLITEKTIPIHSVCPRTLYCILNLCFTCDEVSFCKYSTILRTKRVIIDMC